MSFRWICSAGLATLLTITCAGLFNPAQADSLTYEVIFDTTTADSGLASGPGGFIQVTVSAASPSNAPSLPSVSISLYNASTDGTLGSVSGLTGPITGDLTASVSGTNAAYAELDQNFSVQSFFDVFVTVSGSEIGPGYTPSTGTAIGINIYDNNITEIGATGLVGGGIVTWSSFTTVGSYTTPSAPITVIPQVATPEPSSVVLLGLGLGASQ